MTIDAPYEIGRAYAMVGEGSTVEVALVQGKNVVSLPSDAIETKVKISVSDKNGIFSSYGDSRFYTTTIK